VGRERQLLLKAAVQIEKSKNRIGMAGFEREVEVNSGLLACVGRLATHGSHLSESDAVLR
jgi:hypothetical protein